jgi:starvation-inducible outer membrane lipoprotein
MGDTSPKSSDGGKYTPPPKRQDADVGAVVVRAASRGGVPVHYPQLTDTNYGVWAVKMKIIMRTLGCWSAIDGKGDYDQARCVSERTVSRRQG